MKKVFMGALAMLLIAFGVGCAEPEEDVYTIEVSVHYGETDIKADATQMIWDEVELRTNGRLQPVIHYGAVLAHHTEALYLTRDGLADAADIITMYFSADLPLTSILNLPFMTDFYTEQGRAFADVYANSPEVQREWKNNNVIPLWSGPTGGAVLVSKPKLESLDDLQGLRIRATAYIAEAMSALGATPMAIGGAEYYDAAARGIIDAVTSIPLSSVKARSMYEVTDYLYTPGIGMFTGDVVAMNLDSWNKLPEDIQQVLLDMDPYSLTADTFEAAYRENFDFVATKMEYVQFPPDEEERLRVLASDPLKAMWLEEMEGRGLPGPEVMKMYEEALEKYNAQPLISVG